MNIHDIKLIVWDLDETFWRGTISEGNIDLVNENLCFLKKTTDMGIVHSICSKNSWDVVEKYLTKANLWEYFVFPSISWEAKGFRVKKIIELANLRAKNVLFVDDNPQNLEEVKYFCEGIMTASPADLDELFHQAEKAEATDISHNRLAQYRILEQKTAEKKDYVSNEDFLLSCNIQVTVSDNCLDEIDRLAELVKRSNQLNYTKKRQSKEELEALLTSPEVTSGYVSAKDKYGEYGIVGLFVIKNEELVHFTFSCRTLGMGIEQYIYYTLHCPRLHVQGEVAVKLNNYDKPKWINQESGCVANAKRENTNKKILLKGPCDMSQLFSFICSDENIKTEFSYTNDKGILIEGHNHTAQIVTSLRTEKGRKNELVNAFEFFDKDQFTTLLQTESFDYVVLSMLTDGNLGLYKSKQGDEYVALCEKHYDLTDKRNAELYTGKKIFTSNIVFTEQSLDDFSKQFEYLENTGDVTVRNLEIIRNTMSPGTTLVLLLGSEREFHKKTMESYLNRHREHAVMNRKIRQWAAQYTNVILMDFDKYIKNDSDFLDTINHFVKRVYYSLACDLVALFNEGNADVSVKSRGALYKAEFLRILKQVKRRLLK